MRLLTWRSSAQIWAELHEQAFRRLGGTVKVIVLDNLGEGVLTPDIYDPALNPLYRDVLAHYGVVALPCRVGDPDRKGKVEAGVGHAQKTPLKGLRFETLEAAQAYLDRWETHWADTRIHGTTKRQVAVMFAEERPALGPLPVEPFRYYRFGDRTVHLDGCVEVEGAYYGAPPGWLGQRVQVQWNDLHVRLLAPKTGQLLREHLRTRRGWHRIHDDDRPARTPPSTLALLGARDVGRPAHRHASARTSTSTTACPASAASWASSRSRRNTAPAVVEDAAKAALEIGVPTYRFLRRYARPPPARAPDAYAKSIRSSGNSRSIAISLTAKQETPHESRRTRSRAPQTPPLRHGRRPRNPAAPGADREARAARSRRRSLVTDELQRRQDRLFERRHKQARFRDPDRSLDRFDFDFNKKMNRALIHELATARFVGQREDALFLGPPGTGKSHLAQAIGRAAIQQGYRVVYREAHTLIEEIADATLDGTRKVLLADLAAVPLLIIDDLGMRKLPHTAAEDLLELDHAPLRTGVHAPDVEPTGRRLGQAARRHRRRHRAARSAPTSRPRAQVRAAELAHQGPDRLAHGGGHEVELHRSRSPARKWPVLKCRSMAGFEVSTEGVSAVLHQHVSDSDWWIHHLRVSVLVARGGPGLGRGRDSRPGVVLLLFINWAQGRTGSDGAQIDTADSGGRGRALCRQPYPANRWVLWAELTGLLSGFPPLGAGPAVGRSRGRAPLRAYLRAYTAAFSSLQR